MILLFVLFILLITASNGILFFPLHVWVRLFFLDDTEICLLSQNHFQKLSFVRLFADFLLFLKGCITFVCCFFVCLCSRVTALVALA